MNIVGKTVVVFCFECRCYTPLNDACPDDKGDMVSACMECGATCAMDMTRKFDVVPEGMVFVYKEIAI